MVLGSRRRKLTNWGGWRFRIGVVIVEECLDVLDFVVNGIKDICASCQSVDEVIRSSVLNILVDVLHLEVH